MEVEVAVLGSPSLIVRTVSVDVKNHVAGLKNTVIKYASGKPSNPLRGYSYARLEVTTAPPNRGHDSQNAVSYNCDSLRPSGKF